MKTLRSVQGFEGHNRPLTVSMAKKNHISETPATAWLKAHGVAFTEHPKSLFTIYGSSLKIPG